MTRGIHNLRLHIRFTLFIIKFTFLCNKLRNCNTLETNEENLLFGTKFDINEQSTSFATASFDT